MQYSDKLIDEFIAYFKEEHNHEYTREEANSALDSVAKLYLILARNKKTD